MLKTCAKCPALTCKQLRSARVYGCSHTDTIVPHSTDSEKAVFWRIPLECPLPDSEVHKAETRVDEQEWETVLHGS